MTVAIVLAVTAALFVAPVGIVWWSCRVAPPVSPRRRHPSTLDMARALGAGVRAMADFEAAFQRMTATCQATAADVQRLAEAMRAKP